MDNAKVTELAISDNGFIFDPATGYSYTANATGFSLLRMLQTGMSKAEIREKMLDEYEATGDHFDSDFEHFLLILRSLNLLLGNEEDGDAAGSVNT